jgi:hypothetical protein
MKLCIFSLVMELESQLLRVLSVDEDALKRYLTYVGNAPRVLAALQDAILNLFRACGWENIGDAVRHYAAKGSHMRST